MRSIQSRNRNLGIQNAQLSAVATIRRASDRPSFAKWCASKSYESRFWLSMRESLRHLMTVTGVTTRVTGGALYAVALQRPGQHAPCCLAAR